MKILSPETRAVVKTGPQSSPLSGERRGLFRDAGPKAAGLLAPVFQIADIRLARLVALMRGETPLDEEQEQRAWGDRSRGAS